ncbi:major facilitator superfamily domain-containing protein [Hyaloraphidium curvatum]|nr:major facilitator superfamily domain-containing protein [Hyaloraphidium curvatum]
MLVWEDNASSSTLPDGADSRVQVISPFATMEDDRKLAVDTTVPDVEESWDSLRQAVFMPGTPLPTLQYLASAFFAESSEIVFLATGVVLKGPAAILELFKQTAASSYGVDALQNEIISQVSGTDVVSGRRTMVETVIFGLVHDQPISWLLPDVKPTRKRIVLPMDINVAFGTDGQTGRKVVTSVRVFFDLGSVMRQIGLLPQSLYCKANSSETTLPVVGVRVADPLTVNRKPSPTDEEERPAGPRSHIVSPQKMKESRVFSAPADEPIRTSTRIFQKPTSDVFSDKTEPLRTSVPIDPRRYETHVNVFNPNETPVEEGEKPGKSSAAGPGCRHLQADPEAGRGPDEPDLPRRKGGDVQTPEEALHGPGEQASAVCGRGIPPELEAVWPEEQEPDQHFRPHRGGDCGAAGRGGSKAAEEREPDHAVGGARQPDAEWVYARTTKLACAAPARRRLHAHAVVKSKSPNHQPISWSRREDRRIFQCSFYSFQHVYVEKIHRNQPATCLRLWRRGTTMHSPEDRLIPAIERDRIPISLWRNIPLLVVSGNWIAMACVVFLPVYAFEPSSPSLSPEHTFLEEPSASGLALVESMTFLGWMIGATCLSMLSDAFGRRPTMLVSGYLISSFLLMSVLVLERGDVLGFAIFRAALGFCVGGGGLVAFSLGIEVYGPEVESHTGWGAVLFNNNFAIGGSVLAAFAYFVPDWRFMTAGVALFQIALVTACLFLAPESPTWLAATQDGLKSASAATNGDLAPGSTTFGDFLLPEFARPLLRPPLATRLVLLFSVWFTAVHVYYGITLDATNLGTDGPDATGGTPPTGLSLYQLSFLLNLLAIPAQTLSAFAIARIGGPRTLVHSFWLSGASFLATACAAQFGLLRLASAFVTVGSFFENLAFCALYSATAVMFPTTVRNTAMGWLASVSKTGAMLAPVVVHQIGGKNLAVPFWIFSSMSFLCACVMHFFGSVWLEEEAGETDEDLGREDEDNEGPSM